MGVSFKIIHHNLYFIYFSFIFSLFSHTHSTFLFFVLLMRINNAKIRIFPGKFFLFTPGTMRIKFAKRIKFAVLCAPGGRLSN